MQTPMDLPKEVVLRTRVLGYEPTSEVIRLEYLEGQTEDYAVILLHEIRDKYHICVPRCPKSKCDTRFFGIAVPVADIPAPGAKLNSARAVALEKIHRKWEVVTDDKILDAIEGVLAQVVNEPQIPEAVGINTREGE